MQAGDPQQKCHNAADHLSYLLIGIIYSAILGNAQGIGEEECVEDSVV